MSKGEDARGPWNEGKSSRLKEEWQYIDNPLEEAENTDGLLNKKIKGSDRTEEQVRKQDEQLAKKRSKEILSATPEKDMKWSKYQNSKKDGKI